VEIFSVLLAWYFHMIGMAFMNFSIEGRSKFTVIWLIWIHAPASQIVGQTENVLEIKVISSF
jgi:hypothetical protein